MVGFIIRTVVTAAIGGAIGWFLADVLSDSNFRQALVISSVVAAVVGGWIASLLRLRIKGRQRSQTEKLKS